MSLELCRLCGKNSGLTDVFQEQDLWSKIFMCFGVKISKEDAITRKICKSCYFFTNSVFEFRLSSIAHDDTLRKEFLESQPKTDLKSPIIVYPSEISQDAFLNTLNLASKNEVDVFKKPLFHPSVVRLKRKYPNLNLPKECLDVDLDPTVEVEITKIPKLDPGNLGIWSVKKKLRGKQSDLILTRVRDESALDSDSGSDSSKVKLNFKQKNSVIESPPSTIPPAPPKKRQPRNYYPVYGTRKSSRHARSPQKKSPDKPKNEKETKKHNIPAAADDRVALKSLIQSDAEMNESLQKEPVETAVETTIIEPPIPRLEDYDNLLVSRGEEVQTFICQTCNKIFDTLQLLNQHKKFSHKSSLRCTKCSKRFSIVETLMKHNLSCHAEPPKQPIKVEEKKEVIKTVARKKTSGSVPIVPPASSNISNQDINKDIIEYVISSDEEIEMSKEVKEAKMATPEKPPKEIPPPAIENVINAALEPQKYSNSIEQNSILKTALSPLIGTTMKDKETVEKLLEKEKMPTPPKQEVFLIDDSDDEQPLKGSKSAKTNKPVKKTEEPFLIDDTSGDSSKSKEIAATLPPISTIVTRKRSDSNSSSLPSTSSNNFGENDANISQNIVVVPSAEDKEHMDASSSVQAKITNELSYVNYIFNKCSFIDKPKNDKKYFLKDIQRFTEKTYLPVEIIKSTREEVTIEYGPISVPKPGDKIAFWDTGNVIDIRKPDNPSKKINILPKPGGSDSQPNTSKTSVSQVLKSVRIHPKNSKTFAQVPPTQQTMSIQPAATQSELTKIAPSPKRAFLNSGEDLSKAMLIVPNTSNYQFVSNSPMSFTKTNVVLPSVTVSKIQTCVPSNAIHSQAAKHKLMTVQSVQSNQIAAYSKPSLVSFLPKPVQTVSPSRGPMPLEVAKTIEQPTQLSTGYILMGITATQDGVIQPSANGPIIIGDLDDNNKIPKPIVINGMSYPSVTKIRSQQPSTIVLQPMVQETNVNIQNCINVRQDNSTNISEQYATLTLPLVIGSQPNNQSVGANNLQSIMSTAQIQNATTTTSSAGDLTLLAPKPAIRIKNLSELRGENVNMNTNQRNELHSLYTNALTNYVQNHSSTMATRSNSEEYLQIS